MVKRKWIQKLKKGTFRSFAEEHRLLNKDGTISLKRSRSYINRHLRGRERTHRLRQLNAARTLRKIRPR